MTDQPATDVAIFEAERPRLRGIAYRILGTPDDADDIVQEAWLRYSADAGAIDNPAGWLTTVVTRLAIDRLRSAQHRRETYVGPWLANPLFEPVDPSPGPDDAVLLAESLTLGFLAVLERLSPLERAVFILHRVFDTPLAEVATIIERNEAATRQLSKRAGDHIAEARPRYAAAADEVEELANQVLAAAMTGDIATLESFLAEDVVHLSDGGPDHRAARAPVLGRSRVARLFVGLAKRFDPAMEFHVVPANGQPAFYTVVNDEPFMLHVSNWVDGLLTGSFAVVNPDKLAAFHTAWKAAHSTE